MKSKLIPLKEIKVQYIVTLIGVAVTVQLMLYFIVAIYMYFLGNVIGEWG